MKQTKHILATIALLLGSLTASAHDFSVNGIYYNITSSANRTVEVTYQGNTSTSYDDEYKGSVYIPSSVTYGGMSYRVTSIGYAAFESCHYVTIIFIPAGVTSIGDYAFDSCRGLTGISISDNSMLTSIGEDAFYQCSSLTSITIPESVTSIGEHAFSYCSNLTTINIPEGVTSIGDGAFSYCKSLSSIIIPEGVTSIGIGAFIHCSSLTSIILPARVKKIGDDAFYASSLNSITCNAVTPPTVGSITFGGVSSRCNVYVPAVAVDAYKSAEYWNEFTNIIGISGVIASGNCGTNLVWALYGDGKLVIEGTGAMTNYSSSAYVPWYSFKTSIKGVTLSEGVTSIGNYAFYGCSSLSSVIIPEGVTSIGDWAFRDCSSLAAITLPEGVMSIGRSAFYNCSSLTAITIPEGVTSIGNEAFEGCRSLTSITIPENSQLTSIGSSAFYGCSSLTAITIPDGVTSIGGSAFHNCSSLATITIPASITSIGSSAFYGTPWYNNQPDGVVYVNNVLYKYKGTMPANTSIDVREGTVSISPSAFSSCSGLTSITIPEGVTSIGSSAFRGCSSLTSITIPESVTSIGSSAFNGCSSLTSITIPEGVTSIGSSAFSGCSSLASITCNAATPPTIGNSDTFANVDKSIPVYVPAGSVEAYKAAAYWSEFTNYQPLSSDIASGTCGDNLTWKLTEDYELVIEGTGDMYDYTQGGTPWSEYRDAILAITLPEGMTRIGHWAFSDCTSITAITIPAGVTSIGYGILMGCTNLTSIVVEEGNTVYDSRNGCNAIIKKSNNTLVSGCAATVIPQNVTSIGNRAFGYCTFTTIDIPEGVTSIGDYAFGYCSSLATIILPESMTAVGTGAFVGCRKLAELTSLATTPPALGSNTTFGNVNKSIPVYVPAASVEAYKSAEHWSEFTNIKGVVASGTCGDNLTWRLTEEYELVIEGTGDMYDYSLETTPWYEYRESIQTITLPEGVTSIGEYAFCDCSSLTSITIPENVASIGESAFNGCSSLSSVIIPESVTSIGKLAFAWCSNLITITVADGNAVYDSRGGCNAIIETSSNTLITGCSTTIIPESVTGIGYGAFNGHSGLLAITIPEGVTNFGLGAFSYCNSLTNLTVPESVTSIGEQAFEGCSSLTAIAIPEGVTSIRYRSFHGCSNLTEITLPENVTSIGAQAFEGCSSLTSITIPEGVTSIGVYAFDGTAWYDNQPDGVIYAGKVLYMYKGTMPANTSVEVKEGTVSITGFAFDGCSSLTSITIPESVTSIEYNAFDGCYALTAITCHAVTPPTVYSSTFGNVNKSILVYVPAASVGAYQSAAYWSEFTNILPIEEPTPDYVTITISKYGSGTYSSAYALDFSEVQGLKAYVATGYNYHTGVVTLLRVHTADAATGLLVKGTPGASYEVPVMEYTADRTLNMLVPTLERTEVDSRSNDGVYANYKYTVDPAQNPDEPLFYPFVDNSHLSAGKAYLQIPVAWLPATGQKSIRYRFDEGETTDIEDEEIRNHKSEIIYDLYGRRVVSPKKGEIYIINNQKVVY